MSPSWRVPGGAALPFEVALPDGAALPGEVAGRGGAAVRGGLFFGHAVLL